MLAPLPDGVSVSVTIHRQLPWLVIHPTEAHAMPMATMRAVSDAVLSLDASALPPGFRCEVAVSGPDGQSVDVPALDAQVLAAHILSAIRQTSA